MTVLDTPQGDGPPAAHFPAVGDSVTVGIVDVDTYQQKDYDTGEPATWPDGSRREGKVVTGLIINSSGTADAGSDRQSTPVEPGDLVRFWCEGGRYYTYRDAVRAAGGVNVGDIMLWRRDADKPATNPRHNPAKVYTAKIRRPEPKDGDIVTRCEQARINLRTRTILDTDTSNSSSVYGDEEPF
jgi:hypothetical protein